MAIFRPSSIVGAISGTLNASAFVNNSRGAIVRKRPNHTKKRSPALMQHQAQFVNVQRTWRTLTEDERTSWRTTALRFPEKNRLGISRSLTGFQLYMKFNVLRAATGIALQTEPPTNYRTQPFIGASLNLSTAPIYSFGGATTYPLNFPPVVIFAARTFSNVQPTSFPPVTLLGTFTQVLFEYPFTSAFIAAFGELDTGEYMAVRAIPWDGTALPAQEWRLYGIAT